MKARAPRRYVPKKNSAPYAILITLYRAAQTGKEYMMKQELIDAAEASGLSHMPIEPNKGVVPPRFGAGPQFSYSGWSSMKTLVDRSLVVKKNCPAK
jgi:crossover junction endonuclease MUS81